MDVASPLTMFIYKMDTDTYLSATLGDLGRSVAPQLDYPANARCLRPVGLVRHRNLLVQEIVMFQVI